MSHPFRYIIQSGPWYTIKLATRFSLYVFDHSLTVYVKMIFFSLFKLLSHIFYIHHTYVLCCLDQAAVVGNPFSCQTRNVIIYFVNENSI